MHKIPEIDVHRRDPIMESYQDHDPKTNETAAVDKEKNLNENGEPQETSDTDEIQVDDKLREEEDPNYIYDKVLRQYTDEELESCLATDIEIKVVLFTEQLESENPNFKILEEYKKRVCKII